MRLKYISKASSVDVFSHFFLPLIHDFINLEFLLEQDGEHPRQEKKYKKNVLLYSGLNQNLKTLFPNAGTG
jgi:hypothetical protein